MSYEDWARAFHGHAFLHRSAETNAGFVLPHLEPGQRLVDIGCGPGTITAGLAQRVAPGEVVGVDHDAGHLATARELHHVPNLRFEQGDAGALPLPDGDVDVAFLHAVLQHVDSPEAVLAEARRVVRPGGTLAAADADMDGYLLHPRSPDLDAAMALDRRTRRNPDIGRRLPALLLGAGFTEVECSVRANVVSGRAVEGAAAATVRRLEADPFVQHAVERGWATAAELTDMAAAWRSWSETPGALLVTLWCQAVAT